MKRGGAAYREKHGRPEPWRTFLLAGVVLIPMANAQPLSPLSCGIPAMVTTSSCPALRPGGAIQTSNGMCTLNFVVTDDVDLFIGTAGHCVQDAERVRIPGSTEVGTVILDGHRGDWAFIRVDPEARPLLDPTLAQWGGPVGVAPPSLGRPVLHYGQGPSPTEGPQGRVGEILSADPRPSAFWFAGHADHGDSGSPVILSTGEAVGIVVATLLPGSPSVVVATRFDLALGELEASLGRPVRLVHGHSPVIRP